MNRSSTLLTLLCAAISLTLLPGCQTTPNIRQVTAADSGSTVQLSTGDFLEVELESNPTTGFSWQTLNINSWVLARMNRPGYTPAQPGLMGSGGTLKLTYRAVGPGESPLALGYSRVWETNVAPAKTFDLKVVVK